MKLKLDLHSIFNRNSQIEEALRILLREAIEKKVTMIEIITGKGSGQLRKRVLKYFERKKSELPPHQLFKDQDNYGRIFVKFNFKRGQ